MPETAIPDAPKVPHWPALGRGLVARCPRCGARGILASLFEVAEHCPRCGMRFEREEGYWLGAMALVTGVVLVAFTVIMTVALVAFDDVPWVGLTVVLVVVNGGLPIFGYGWAKTAWMGLDYAFNPATTTEEADAILRRAPADDAAAGEG
jgi:uncharacterized protein (DUF983 family)